MRSNCIIVARIFYRRLVRKGKEPYYAKRWSRWGRFKHRLVMWRMPSGYVHTVSFKPVSPAKQWLPPPLFRGEVKWGDWPDPEPAAPGPSMLRFYNPAALCGLGKPMLKSVFVLVSALVTLIAGYYAYRDPRVDLLLAFGAALVTFIGALVVKFGESAPAKPAPGHPAPIAPTGGRTGIRARVVETSGNTVIANQTTAIDADRVKTGGSTRIE